MLSAHRQKKENTGTKMIGVTPRSNPTVQVPPWDLHNDHPSVTIHSPFSITPNGNASNFNDLPFDTLTAFQRYLPSNNVPDAAVSDTDDLDIPVDAFSCDQFRMYEFKVRKCARARSHDWTECPYTHPGEKARRRDPRKYHYSGSACPDFRKGTCKKGDSCEYAHGVFECWLHPARYRTQPCKDGTHCRRRVCFFAHTADQLRLLPQPDSYDGSPARLGCNSPRLLGFSPTSVLHSPPSSPCSDSPPLSPSGTVSLNSVNCLADSMRNLHIGSRRMTLSSPAWGVQLSSGICSPGSPMSVRPGFVSLPSTSTQNSARPVLGAIDLWDRSRGEEAVMERVESGKDLRAKIYAKLSKENFLESSGPVPGPDLGWISELVK